MQREHTLHTHTETDLANRDRLAHPGVVAGDEDTFKRLKPFLVSLTDPNIDTQRVARLQLRNLVLLVGVVDLLQHFIHHVGSPWRDSLSAASHARSSSFSAAPSKSSGRLRHVFFNAACRRHWRISS